MLRFERVIFIVTAALCYGVVCFIIGAHYPEFDWDLGHDGKFQSVSFTHTYPATIRLPPGSFEIRRLTPAEIRERNK